MARGAGRDLTVLAAPLYFGSMEVERRWLRRRAEVAGPSPAEYTSRDTRTSLTMGLASLVIPLATSALVKHVTPGRGRFGRALVGTAVAATIVTSVADRVDGNAARRVASVGGPVAIGTGWLAVGSALADRTSATRQWRRKGKDRDLGRGVLAWLVAVIGWDFIYYWNHRFMHEVRGLWAYHVVHHSSERYNLSTALRQPVADSLGIWVPYGLLARAGVRPTLVEQARGINLLYQFWIHTDTIRSLGRAEAAVNSPSHHRVHHGSNRRYLDRNHGSILIVWDRLFGTFEREDETVVYGLTRNIETFHPIRVIGHEYADIFRDVAGSRTWRDRLSFVLRRPGWAVNLR